jgi:transposase
MLVDGRGVPLSFVVSGANVSDFDGALPTLEDVVVPRPDPAVVEQHVCADKGYDSKKIRAGIEALGLKPHIRSRGEEALDLASRPGTKARRYVVEAGHSWLNRFRKLLVRYEKKAENFFALLFLASAIIAWRLANGGGNRRGIILG